MADLSYLPRGIRLPAELDAATAAIRDQIIDAATDDGGQDNSRRSPIGTADVMPSDDGAVLVRWEAILRLITPAPPELREEPLTEDSDRSEEQFVLNPEQFGLPPIAEDITPFLTHVGSPLDRTFEIELRELRQHGQRIEIQQVHENTPWIRVNGSREVLLSEPCWHLIRELQLMRRRPDPARTTEQNWRHWAIVRDAALAAGAELDTFLQNTRVLLPKHLRLLVDEEGSGSDRELIIHPHFDGAPPEWINQFERRAISGVYRVPSGQDYYEIIVADEVQVALAAIKGIPGRRLRGATAQRFISNPMAALGPEIGSVLDADDVQRVYDELRRNVCRFEPLIEAGQPPRVHVLVEPLEKTVDEQHATILEELGKPAMVLSFCSRIEAALADGLEQFSWRGHDLATDGSSTLYAQQLRAAHDAWTGQPTGGQAETGAESEPGGTSDPLLGGDLSAIDLSRYYERIEGVGYETPYAIARIPRPKELGGWLPEEIALSFAPIAAPEAEKSLTLSQVADFEDATDAASQSGAPDVELPDGTTLPIDEAKALIDTTPNEVLDTARAATGRAPKSREPERPKASLLIAPNIDTADYVEQRALAFALPDGASARMPAGLRAETTLKPHQLDGVAWMQHLRSFGENACRGALLADDMGLGKTLQLLTFIVEELERDPMCSPALVVAPVTLLENWEKEIDRFFRSAPPLRTLYGTAVRNLRANPGDVDPNLRATGRSILRDDWLGDARIVLTTYETVRDLQFSIAEQDWSIVVCDEAQKIKNPNALWTRAVKKLKAEFRIAATGTPVENSIQDIWSIFDFIQPGLLDPLNVFSRKYRRPIESKTEEERNRVEELREILHPQILRRTKEEVAKDLPNKIIDMSCLDLAMAPGQVALYEAEVQRISGGAYGSSQEFAIEMLNALRFFRHLCVDPSPRGQQATADLPLEQYRAVSPKFDWLIGQLDAIRDRDEKAIVFVEMRDIQRQLKQYLEARYGLSVSMINGETTTALGSPNSRQRQIDVFQEHPGFNVIILSPLAAGVGLNIQQANHVIHYVRHWNPAREDQATDRAYRIGQTRDVTVYTPTVRGPGWMSFEETLDRLLAIKRQLAGDMLDGVDDVERELLREFANRSDTSCRT